MSETGKQSVVTCVQQAGAIIKTVGAPYQHIVAEKLRGLTYGIARTEVEKQANAVISNMYCEYVLNVANVLIIEKYDQIPQYVKNYTK